MRSWSIPDWCFSASLAAYAAIFLVLVWFTAIAAEKASYEAGRAVESGLQADRSAEQARTSLDELTAALEKK